MSLLNIAHRGASGDAPENTLEAFALAAEQGADMIETDLHITHDGAIVLRHDFTEGRREISELSLEELRGRRPDLPTLEEALDLDGPRLPFNLELKCRPESPYVGLEDRVVAMVRERGRLGATLFSCFELPVLERIRECSPAARIGLLVLREGSWARSARGVGAEAVHLHRKLATPERIDALHSEELKAHVYTVDDPAEMKRLLGWGVDGIFTNFPARLSTVKTERQ